MGIAILIKNLESNKISVYTVSRDPEPLDLNKPTEVFTVVKTALINQGILKPEYVLEVSKTEPNMCTVKDNSNPKVDKATIHIFDAPHIQATVKYEIVN